MAQKIKVSSAKSQTEPAFHFEDRGVLLSDEPSDGTQADRMSLPKDGKDSSVLGPVLKTQLLLCLFIGALCFFAWREGGELWAKLSGTLGKMLQNGISFSGEEQLTRFTDEVRSFWGTVADAFCRLS